ncbi:MAG TPA: HAD family acid phosphatase [Candidatus Limnocylindrales bacterium]|nr:HAD family acid phosphatase [Candidatus Limnocylindrales bacterium]
MSGPAPLRASRALRTSRALRAPRAAVLAVVLVLVTAGAVIGASATAIHIITPQTADQITNIDILRSEIKNYYGTPGASTGSGATAGWTLDLDQGSNYADEARKVAAEGWSWLKAQAGKSEMQAVVFDVDDTTLTTYDYELYSNWDYNPTTNGYFVGLTNGSFTGNIFPATPGMVELAQKAHDAGYAVFFLTGRGDSQHLVTIANLVNDEAAGFTDLTTTTSGALSTQVDEVDAGYPMPTAVDTGHGGFADGLFTKPPVGSYPSYLDTPQFCGAAIDAGSSCATIAYKSGTRAYIESLGYDIVANFGDQYSDLTGGYADRTFKMPNPNYYLP